MSIDWNAIFAGIPLIAAIISPIATAIITNRFSLKLKKLELYEKRKLDAIDAYIKSASNAAYVVGVPKDFSEMCASVFLYTPLHLHPKIKDLNKKLEGGRFDEVTINLLFEVASELQSETKKSN